MPTPYKFTSEQLTEIARLRQMLLDNPNKAEASGAVPLYSYLFKCVTGMDYGPGAVAAISVMGIDDSVRRSATWLAGAIQINSSSGAFSMVIREFNVRQGQLRGKGTFTAAQLQEASNRVGINLADSILNPTLPNSTLPSPTYQRLPTVQEIGNSDLNGVRDVLYPGNENPGAELYLNQAWPGIVMLGALGGKYTDRLLRYDDNSPSLVDKLSDFKSMLFCWDAFKTAWDKTLQAFPLGLNDLMIGLNFPASIIPSITNAQDAFAYMINAQQPAADLKAAFKTIGDVGQNKFLDMLMGATVGQSLLGSTTDANFASKANTFFSAYGSTLETIGAKLLPTDAAGLAALAKQNTPEGANARAALGALSVISVQVSATTADAFSLYDPASGQGHISAGWITDRAAFTSAAYQQAKGLGGIVPGNQNARYFDAASGTEVLVGAGSAQRVQYLFGGSGEDTLQGQAMGDHLYGGAGNDTLDGGFGNDSLEGGQGNDTYSFNGTWGKDTLTDSDGLGQIQIDGQALGTFKGAGTRGGYAFDLGGGHYAGLAVYQDATSSTGYKAIILKGMDSAHTITIDDTMAGASCARKFIAIHIDHSGARGRFDARNRPHRAAWRCPPMRPTHRSGQTLTTPISAFNI